MDVSTNTPYIKNFYLVGVNHERLPVSERECLARLEVESPTFLPTLLRECVLEEAAVLSTCNRFEIIGVTGGTPSNVVTFLSERVGQSLPDGSFYRLTNDEALKHFFRVASSLDSMVVGEPQILGQVRSSYDAAVAQGCVGRFLHHLFQFTFSLAKKVRANTTIGERAISISYIAVQLAEQIFGSLKEKTVLILGGGQMAELAALHFRTHGARAIIVANRTLQRAVELAERIGGSAISLDEVPEYLKQADIVLGSLGADHPIVDTTTVEKLRRRKPIFFIDLGVPRNFPSSLGEIDDVYLYTLDDLGNLAEGNRLAREKAAKEAEVIIDFGLFQFERWLTKVSAEPAILDFRTKLKGTCEEELNQALAKYVHSEAERQAIVAELSHRLSQKISHDVTMLLGSKPYGQLDESTLLPLLFDGFLKIL